MGSKANFQQENNKREKSLSGNWGGEEGGEGESRVYNSPKAFGELKKSKLRKITECVMWHINVSNNVFRLVHTRISNLNS